MGLFDKMREPVFLREESELKAQLAQLEAFLPQASEENKKKIEQEIQLLKAGIYGEEQIVYELKNSHMPLYILRDIYLECGELSAQIDFIVVAPKCVYILECKNLFGDIEINRNGDFIRTFQYGNWKKKEGIYSPITQNERHLELIRQIISEKRGVLGKLVVDSAFSKWYRSVVVLANPKTVLQDRYAPKTVKNQVIRGDGLIRYLKECEAQSKEVTSSEKNMKELAESFLQRHKSVRKDYTEKFREKEELCPQCGGVLVKRSGKYGEFYGCSNFPQCRYTRKLENE